MATRKIDVDWFTLRQFKVTAKIYGTAFLQRSFIDGIVGVPTSNEEKTGIFTSRKQSVVSKVASVLFQKFRC